MSYKNIMRFMFSETELCPEKENNKKKYMMDWLNIG